MLVMTRTPISSIQGYCETLLGVGNDPKIRNKFLRIIQREIYRMRL